MRGRPRALPPLVVLALVLALTGAAAPLAAAAGPHRRGHAATAEPPGLATPPTPGAGYTDGPQGRDRLAGPWLLRLDPGGVGLAQGWWRNVASTAGWAPVTVPNAYNAGDFSNTSMYGETAWYRRDFTLPPRAFARYVPNWARAWVITFESVGYHATVWLNGRELGSHDGAYLPFEYVLKGVHAGVNRLIVRVDNTRGPNSFPAGPSGGWWNFGGILDQVLLRPVQRADISALAIATHQPCPRCSGQATVTETATVRNLSPRREAVALNGSYGPLQFHLGSAVLAPGQVWSPQVSFTIHHPKLWSPEHPNLYRASLRLNDMQGRRLGGYTELSGIRTITRTAGGRLELNGRLLDLRGLNMHEQDIRTGAALTIPQLRQRLNWVRALGGTIIREHYPLDPEAEEMADRDGLLLWSEIPVYQTPAANFGVPAWRAAALRLLAENIQTNGDHPSILLWSIGNEFPTPATRGEASYIAQAAAEAHALDPTRPVGMAASDWPGVACQTAYAPLDVIGINEYFGWFDAGGGTTDDRDGLGPFLDSVRACYPHQAIMVTEFGFNGNRNGPVEDRGTYAFQSNSIAFHLGVMNTKRWLSGAIYFNLMDFAAKPGYDGANPLGTPPWVTNGVVDAYGNEKPAFAVMSALYHGVTQIGR